VAAAGVNNTDINTRVAWYSKQEGSSEDASWAGQAINFPRIQGIDVCGHIVAVGKAVNKDRMGERVLVEPCIRELDVRTLYLQDHSQFGCTVLEPEVFKNLINIIEHGRISPVIAQTFDLEEIHDAQKMFMDKKFVGKIVLRIQ
jgi:NADPH:quinone reductase-like Zn-dependent oxidoreductase